MTDAATEPKAQTAPNPDNVTGTVAVKQPISIVSNIPPEEQPVKEHDSFWGFLKRFFEPGATSQHFQLIAHDSEGKLKVSVQPTGKAGDMKEFHVDPDTHAVTNVSAPAQEA